MNLFDENYRRKLIQEIVYWKTPPRLSLGPGLGAFLGLADERAREHEKQTLQQLSEEQLNIAHSTAKAKFELTDRASKKDAYNIANLSNFMKTIEPPQNPLDPWRLANSDVGYWCSLEYWTIAEFLALSFDFCPKKATPENFRKFRRYIPESVYQNIMQRTEICRRAHHAHHLQAQMQPFKFIQWAENKNIPLSSEIIKSIKSGSGSSSDKTIPIVAVKEDETPVLKSNNQHKAATARSDTSLYKILYAIAISRYKFDPSKRNSPSPAMILSELERAGLSMDVATIKGHLSKAAEIVNEIKSDG